MSLLALGIDPGFSFVGVALVRLHASREEVLAIDVIKTEKSNKKRSVKACDDNFRRSVELAREIRSWMVSRFQNRLAHYSEESVRIVCAESMSFPRNASTAYKMGLCWGVIAALTARRNLPVVQSSPQEIKNRICGKKDASKEEVELVLRKKYRIKPSMMGKFPAGQANHAFDALASVIGGLDSDVAQMARRMI